MNCLAQRHACISPGAADEPLRALEALTEPSRRSFGYKGHVTGMAILGALTGSVIKLP